MSDETVILSLLAATIIVVGALDWVAYFLQRRANVLIEDNLREINKTLTVLGVAVEGMAHDYVSLSYLTDEALNRILKPEAIQDLVDGAEETEKVKERVDRLYDHLMARKERDNAAEAAV